MIKLNSPVVALSLLAASLSLFVGTPQVVLAEGSSVAVAGMNQRSLKKIARAKKKNNGAPVKGLASVCKSTTPIKALLKNAWPGHISLSDSRATGFALVCSNSDCPRSFPASAYYSDGSFAFKLGYYGTWEGNGRPRAYCGTGGAGQCNASAVTRKAKSKGFDGKVYINFGNGSCRSAVPGQRNGSPF